MLIPVYFVFIAICLEKLLLQINVRSMKSFHKKKACNLWPQVTRPIPEFLWEI